MVVLLRIKVEDLEEWGLNLCEACVSGPAYLDGGAVLTVIFQSRQVESNHIIHGLSSIEAKYTHIKADNQIIE